MARMPRAAAPGDLASLSTAVWLLPLIGSFLSTRVRIEPPHSADA